MNPNHNIQYVYKMNAWPKILAPPDQAYLIPEIMLAGIIRSRRPDGGRNISQQKTVVRFTYNNVEGPTYNNWQQTVKN